MFHVKTFFFFLDWVWDCRCDVGTVSHVSKVFLFVLLLLKLCCSVTVFGRPDVTLG